VPGTPGKQEGRGCIWMGWDGLGALSRYAYACWLYENEVGWGLKDFRRFIHVILQIRLISRPLGSVHVVFIISQLFGWGLKVRKTGGREEERSAFGGRGGGGETNHFANERCFSASAYEGKGT